MALVKYNNNSISAITAASSLTTGAMTLIKSQTASSSSTIDFVDGTSDVVLDSTYPIYVFKFINIHPATDGVSFTFQTDTGMDLAQSTNPQIIAENIGNGSDECASGYLHLFNPSSTTFVKNFLIWSASYFASDYSNNYYVAGYGNTTSAVDAIQFSMSSGNIDSGTIKLYGVS